MTPTATTPDWLVRHGAVLLAGSDGRSFTLYFGPKPEYVLSIVPAVGKYSCKVKQTINGRHLDSGKVHATVAEALQGGLEDLRQVLGW